MLRISNFVDVVMFAHNRVVSGVCDFFFVKVLYSDNLTTKCESCAVDIICYVLYAEICQMLVTQKTHVSHCC